MSTRDINLPYIYAQTRPKGTGIYTRQIPSAHVITDLRAL